MKRNIDEQSFEEALEKIERIVNSLEEGNLPLEESSAKFKEALDLIKFCNKKLETVEQSVKKVVEKEGGIDLEDLEDDERIRS